MMAGTTCTRSGMAHLRELAVLYAVEQAAGVLLLADAVHVSAVPAALARLDVNGAASGLQLGLRARPKLAPLLEVERHLRRLALIPEVAKPIGMARRSEEHTSEL